MTEAAAPAQPSEPAESLQAFLAIWGESFSQTLGQITSAAVPCVVRAEAPPDLTPPDDGDFWAAVTCSGSLRGEMILRFAGATALRLAQIFMSEPSTPEAELTADHREAVVELLRQVSGIVATAASARWGEFQVRAEQAASAPSWSSAGTFWLQIGDPGPDCMALEFGLSAALVAALKAEKPESVKAESTAAATDSSAKPALSAALTDGLQTPVALDLLMDVQLSMTMRFGAKRLLLREVLDLSPGAVVELDRKIQEPVELLLDGKLVARGEVVVIDGNYGLRVTDVSPLEAARQA
jgi:flagellar motor switch protein FliN/FliY